MANESGVLVVAEVAEGALAAISSEVLGAARRLADELGQPVQAALLGQGVEPLAQGLIAAGADKVYVVDDPILAEYQSDAFVPAAEKVCREANPSIVLLGQTDVGRDLAPSLAFRLETAVAMDCLDLAISDGRLVMTRACYGGNANAQHTCNTMPQMATVRVKSQEPLAPDTSRQGEVSKVAADSDRGRRPWYGQHRGIPDAGGTGRPDEGRGRRHPRCLRHGLVSNTEANRTHRQSGQPNPLHSSGYFRC
jgi:electron transfer flavoprotein alpha subunit